jgi:hypothetical protein
VFPTFLLMLINIINHFLGVLIKITGSNNSEFGRDIFKQGHQQDSAARKFFGQKSVHFVAEGA